MKSLKLYGPPGTGKTTELLRLLELELKRVPAERIAFLTFTRAARAEALERVGQDVEFPYLRTLHSICYRQLGLSTHSTLTATALRAWGNALGFKLGGLPPSPWQEEMYGESFQAPSDDDKLLALCHWMRQRELTWGDVKRDSPVEDHYARLFLQEYETWKSREGLLDFTDILKSYADHGLTLPIKVAFVDEAQDLSELQWRVVDRLTANCERVYFAGDDDQAIYTWAGASPRAFVARRVDEVRSLPQSYRVPRVIWDYAQRVISNVAYRYEKTTLARPEAGILDTSVALTEDLFEGDSAFVLYRNHVFGLKLAERLRDAGVPFEGPNSPAAANHSLLLAWEQLTLGRTIKRDTATVLRVCIPATLRGAVDDPKFGGRTMVPWECLMAQRPTLPQVAELTLPYQEHLQVMLRRYPWAQVLAPKVRLSSIHQVKGREADTVVVCPDMTRQTYLGYELDTEGQEHRVWYVAATRARQRLVLLRPEHRFFYRS